MKAWVSKFILALIVLLSLPILINIFFIYGDLSTGTDLGNREWLTFWSGYLGGAATLIAVFLTLRQNSRIVEQNEKIILNNQEETRLSIMPYFEVSTMGIESEKRYGSNLEQPNCYVIFTDVENATISLEYKKNYSTSKVFPLKLSQKSNSLAVDVNIYFRYSNDKIENNPFNLVPPFAMAAGESMFLPVAFPYTFEDGNYTFFIQYKDIRGNRYEQKFLIELVNTQFKRHTVELPTLIN